MNAPTSSYISNPFSFPKKGEISNLSIKDGDSFNVNQKNINITGTAPMAARLKIIVRGKNYEEIKYFLNGKGTNNNRNFSIDLKTPPKGGPYSITITGTNLNPEFNDVKFAKIENLYIK